MAKKLSEMTSDEVWDRVRDDMERGKVRSMALSARAGGMAVVSVDFVPEEAELLLAEARREVQYFKGLWMQEGAHGARYRKLWYRERRRRCAAVTLAEPVQEVDDDDYEF